MLPPSDTEPPPDNPVPAVTVSALLASLAFEMAPPLIVTTPVPLTDASPLSVVNVGTPDPLAISTWPLVPAVVFCSAPAPFPNTTPLVVKLETPVPPYCTPTAVPCHVPLVIVPTPVIELRLPVVSNVPFTLGTVRVRVVPELIPLN